MASHSKGMLAAFRWLSTSSRLAEHRANLTPGTDGTSASVWPLTRLSDYENLTDGPCHPSLRGLALASANPASIQPSQALRPGRRRHQLRAGPCIGRTDGRIEASDVVHLDRAARVDQERAQLIVYSVRRVRISSWIDQEMRICGFSRN